jgi:DHA1 family bicyclomycin/chloramphenicol resistance-like MFS transporter
LIQGIGVAGPYISAVSIVRDQYAGRTMARVMSIIMMIFILVPAIAPTVGQAIMLFASWRYIFVLYIVYAAAVGIWIFLRLPETLPPERRIPLSFGNLAHGFKEVISNRVTISYTICAGIVFGSFMGYLNSSQQIFQVQFEQGNMFAVWFGMLALVLGSASLLNSRFVERLGMAYICLRAEAAIVAASAIFLALHFMVDIELWMFLVYAVVMFFSFGLMFGNLNALSMEPMGHIAGMASAIIGALSSIISMTIGSYIGQMYNNTLIPVVTGFLILGALSLLIIRYAETIRHPQAKS